jgi:hypothetical protein
MGQLQMINLVVLDNHNPNKNIEFYALLPAKLGLLKLSAGQQLFLNRLAQD